MAGSLKAKVYSMVGPHMLHPVSVVDVREVGPRFKRVALQRQDGASHAVGVADKLRINAGDWNVRTYTPLKFPSAADRYEILAFVHGQGPGSAWAAGCTVGAASHLKGPKPTVMLDDAPLLLLGDETSFGTALNFKNRSDVRWLFEVTQVREAEAVLTGIGLRGAMVVPRGAGHRAELVRLVTDIMQAQPTMQALLTGHAQTIQVVLKGLRVRKGLATRVTVKPYWSEGKAGLD